MDVTTQLELCLREQIQIVANVVCRVGSQLHVSLFFSVVPTSFLIFFISGSYNKEVCIHKLCPYLPVAPPTKVIILKYAIQKPYISISTTEYKYTYSHVQVIKHFGSVHTYYAQ